MNMRCDRGVSAESKSSQMHTESGAIHTHTDTHTHTHTHKHKYIYAYIMRNVKGQDRVALFYGVCVCVCVCAYI